MVRFYDINGESYENRSFTNNSIIHRDIAQFVQELPLNYTQPYFLEALSGSYGFTDVSEFTASTKLTNARIENCKYCYDSGSTIYTFGASTQGKKLILKFDGDVSVQVRENGTTITTIASTSGLIIHELTQNYTNLNIRITANTPTCLIGAMVVEPSLTYYICDVEFSVSCYDITPFGGAYLLTTHIKKDWVDNGSVYTDTVNEWEIEILRTDIQVTQGRYLSIIINGEIFNYYEWINGGNEYTFHEVYKWLSYEIIGINQNYVTYKVKAPSFISFYVEYRTTSTLIETYTPTLTTTTADEEWIYIGSDDILELESISHDYYISIGEVGNLINTQLPYYYIAFKNNTQTLKSFELYTLQNTEILVPKDANIAEYVEQSANNNQSVYTQISKKALLDLSFKTCCIEVNGQRSEPFMIVDESDSLLIKCTPNDYLQELMNGFEYQIYLDAYIRKSLKEEQNVFVGQSRNYTLKTTNLNLRDLVTKSAIPDYLSEILEKYFSYDVEIDGYNYSKSEEPEFEYLEQTTLFGEFSIKLRLIK